MFKLFNKSDLTYKNGYLVTDDGTIVPVNPIFVNQANDLETDNQKNIHKDYVLAMSDPTMSEIEEFERSHEHEIKIDYFEVDTPLLDEQAEQSLALMDEIDKVSVNDEMNDRLNDYRELIEFVSDDTIRVDLDQMPYRFDLPTLGDPLKWNYKTIANIVAKSFDQMIVEE